MEVRCRVVARDFKGGDEGRDDLCAETLPLEAKRMLLSKAVTRRADGRVRKSMFVDVSKAHLNLKCEEDVYTQLPEEERGLGPAARAWERFYTEKLEGMGFLSDNSCGVVFYNQETDLSLMVHGDDYTFCGLEDDLVWIRNLMETWSEVKFRGIMGPDVGA
eukprot:10319704-Karenia_brevis.AAC.1